MQKNAQETAAIAGGGKAPPRDCAGCGVAMENVATLPQTSRFPMQHFYRCLACRQFARIEVD